MSLKYELEQWQVACAAFDMKDFDVSIKTFIGIADTAKMHFNIGLIFSMVDDHDHALGAYSKAIMLDPYFAVAYFQRGVSHFIRSDMESARRDFDEAHQKLRGNQIINYQQLGLSFRLYACEVLFNRGICQLYLGKIDAGLTDLYHAQKARMTEEHDVIDLAVKDRGKGYSVFSIPPFVIFRPPENRLRQLNGVDMFAIVDQLNPTKAQQSTIKQAALTTANTTSSSSEKRPNSILLTEKANKYKPKQPSLLSSSASYTIPVASPLPQQKQLPPVPTPSRTTSRARTNSNVGMYCSDDSAASLCSSNNRYRQDGRRVDSGFESTLEDQRCSSSSSVGTNGGKSLAKSFKLQPTKTPPPVPPIPKKHEEDNTYGDFDLNLENVYGSLHTMTVQEREKDLIRQRLASGISSKEEIRVQASTSTSTIGSNYSSCSNYSGTGGKIKIKVHYVDTRVLVVSNQITFDELKSKIQDKFCVPACIRLQYKDEDDEMVLMIDDDDLFMARQINKVSNKVEKIEIWCSRV
ncbi:hypothetical protein BD408DRAFT_432577 [Parasitella parasitica]|nr:hypothetical protein BD408DRAFT_432577 [Parasitella parasitica]